jgi:hypothetical protein
MPDWRQAGRVLRRVVIGGLLLVAIGLFVFAGSKGAEEVPATSISSAVQFLIPDNGSPSVLRQAEIGIDLEPGWVAVLQVNGVEIPEDQYRRVDPENQVFFTPGEGKEIERLAPGRVTVTALAWRPVDGETRENARPITWSFNVV